MSYPKCILLFSGKRKSGKDFLAELICSRLGSETAQILRLSAPIKSHWAESKGLFLEELLGTGEYKEKYRMEMMKWGEEKRGGDSGYFCRAAIAMSNAEEKPVWIVSDARRVSDLEWFRIHYNDVLSTIRIVANDNVRKARGWIFTEGIDDTESECGLDNEKTWNWIIENNGKENDLDCVINDILNLVNDKLSS